MGLFNSGEIEHLREVNESLRGQLRQMRLLIRLFGGYVPNYHSLYTWDGYYIELTRNDNTSRVPISKILEEEQKLNELLENYKEKME